ncbi:MAG: hypothetical protein JWL71_3231 [Acidobacteria bacterium]|nr:hypothetical protein [Acidobacteriota bacterium]
MVWVTLGGVAVCVALTLLLIARRRDGGGGTDLGTISGSWLNEHRAHERDVAPNR